MSQENADNSWYKYLERLQETPKSTFFSRRDIVLAKLSRNNLDPEIKLCLLSYECLMCATYILEIREDDMCEHECCWACAPRIHCRENCKPLRVHALPVDDRESQQEIIDKYKQVNGVRIVKAGPKKRRKNPEDDEDDEMQE